MLMIKTNRVRKVKKAKKNKQAAVTQNNQNSDLESDNANGQEFDPEKPDQMSDDEVNGIVEDTFHDAEMDEESDREENVERQLNFNAEISLLINYEVVASYMAVINNKSGFSKQADLIQMAASFFRRVVYQLKQTWIFFQMDFMHCFNEFLQKNSCTNSLMKGILENTSGDSYGERKLQVSLEQLKTIVTVIVGKFVALQQDNPMLLLESLFRFQTKDIKDQVLNNYSLGVARVGLLDKEDDRERELLNNGAYDDNIIFGDEQAVFGVDGEEADEEGGADQHIVDKNQWTQKQDEILIENYQNFANLEKKSRFTFLAELVGGGKTYKDCYNRAKLLKLKNGTIEGAKEISSNLLSNSKHGENQGIKDRLVSQALNTLCKHMSDRNDGKVQFSQIRAMCDYLTDIQQEHMAYKKAEEDAILFGRNIDMADIQNSKNLAMRVVPVTQEEFKMLRTGAFIAFLAAFGIRRTAR